MNEAIKVKKWVTSKASNDADLISSINKRVYREIPSGADFPLVQFVPRASTDFKGNAGKILITDFDYDIKVVYKSGITESVINICNKLDDLFRNVKGEIFEGFVFHSVRDSLVGYAEKGVDASSFFYHLGGRYRIKCYEYGV